MNAPARGDQVQSLIAEMQRLPPQHNVAVRILRMVDDPNADAASLGEAVSQDPALTVRILGTANSAYYGLSGRVANVGFAITVLGFATVRALAAAVAARLTGDDHDVPPGYWHRASATAVAAATLAPRVGASRQDAFCAGLLADVGEAILFRVAPDERGDPAPRRGTDELERERAAYGISHADATAEVLESWRFPTEMTSAVRTHHDAPSAQQSPLQQTLRAAVAIVDVIDDPTLRDDPETGECLALAHVEPGDVDDLVTRVREQSQEVLSSLM